MAGTFYGVGVGPGDPELITLKAARILSEVDWIFHPSSPRGGGMARSIVSSLGLDPKKFRAATVEMSRDRSGACSDYQRAAEEIVAEIERGCSVAWITEGDPLFYSTFQHVAAEVRGLAPETKLEIVPGVTSIQAAAARAQMPIAHLADKVAVLPAAYGISGLADLLDEFATVVLLKVHAVFDDLLDALDELERPVQVTYVERVGTESERVVNDLSSLRGTEVPYFSLVIVRREPCPIETVLPGAAP